MRARMHTLTRTLRAVCCSLLLAGRLWAQPTHDELAKPLYVLRYASSEGDRGIWQYDMDTNTYRPWRTVFGGSSLSAFEDRIVVLGPTAYEFDLLTARLLRRYALFPPGSGFWEFHGQIVPEHIATALDVPAGIYGFPVCPVGDLAATCPALQLLPGYPVPTTVTDYNLLLRRSILPADTQLSGAATLTPLGGNPLSVERFV